MIYKNVDYVLYKFAEENLILIKEIKENEHLYFSDHINYNNEIFYLLRKNAFIYDLRDVCNFISNTKSNTVKSITFDCNFYNSSLLKSNYYVNDAIRLISRYLIRLDNLTRINFNNIYLYKHNNKWKICR